MDKKIYIANCYRNTTDENLLDRVKGIIKSEPKIYDALPDYPFCVSCDVYIYPVEVDRSCVALHIYSTKNYVQFYQSLKRIVQNNSDLFSEFSWSRQYKRLYLWLKPPYKE